MSGDKSMALQKAQLHGLMELFDTWNLYNKMRICLDAEDEPMELMQKSSCMPKR